MTNVVETHVRLDERGVAWIDDTNIKVVEVVLDRTAYNLTPEEIYAGLGGYLSLAQIYAALAYYYDHQAQLDDEINRQVRESDRLRAESLESPVRKKLRSLGKLP
ncbi:MAG: DUF433 domain-containing protein [Planctomycetaceae bacterium]